MKTKNLLIICVMLLLTGIFFWPTLYRYDKMTVIGNTFPVRINRITGYTEYFRAGEWVPAKGQKVKRSTGNLPYAEKSKITGNASLGYGSFSGKIYNGSSWTVTVITFIVVANNKDGSVKWDRKFKKSLIIPPLSTSSFSIEVTGDRGIDSYDWYVEEVLGYQGD